MYKINKEEGLWEHCIPLLFHNVKKPAAYQLTCQNLSFSQVVRQLGFKTNCTVRKLGYHLY